MNHKKTLGAVVNSVNGLHIRQILDTKGNPSGQFGIYAGKKLFKEYTTSADAILDAQKYTSNKPSHHTFRKVFLTWRDKK